MKVKVQPIFGAEPFSCSTNVRKRIKALGGKPVYGWRIIDKPDQSPLAILKQHHVVWESPAGELQDVTPEMTGVAGDNMVYDWLHEEIEFERDDSVPMGEKALPTKFVPREPKWAQVCEWMTIADTYLKEGDLERCRYWTERANKVAHKHGRHWDTPESIEWKDVFPTMMKP
jgi:hypothetical protein